MSFEHVALNVADLKALQQAGARQMDEVNLADGSLLLMLREPWGLLLQLRRHGAVQLKHTDIFYFF
jgi:hypothetical protein